VMPGVGVGLHAVGRTTAARARSIGDLERVLLLSTTNPREGR
jgi:hypothetical protein